MKRTNYTHEQLEEAVRKSISYAGVLRELGIRQAGGSQCNIKRKISKLQLDTSHFTGMGHQHGKHAPNRRSAESILVKRTTDRRQHGHLLRRALIEIGVEYKCEGCGNTGEWLGKSLTLQVDHINGDWTDDRQDNLRFLCPNCHHQTDNFGTKNGDMVERQTQDA